jgi:hypothetical protein
MAGILPTQPNKLVFPGTNRTSQGINPAHPASQKLTFSATFRGSSFFNTATNNLFPINGTVSGTPAYAMDGIVGPVKDVGISFYYDFVSPGNNVSNITMAAIIRPLNASSNTGIFGFSNSSLTSIASLSTFNPNTLYFSPGTNDTSSGIALSLNPYFVVASYNSTTLAINFLAKNLATGQVKTATVTAPGNWPTPTIAHCSIGKETSYGTFYDGRIAAVMTSHAFLSIPQLLQWAQEPWLFWYPQQFDFGIMLKASVSSSTVVFRRTLSQVGTRVGSRQSQGWQ